MTSFFPRIRQLLLLMSLLLAARFASAQGPGNALAFDGIDDYVRIMVPANDDLTTEFWLNTTQTGGGGAGSQWYAGQGLIDATMSGRSGSTNDFGISLVGNKVAFGISNPEVTIQSTTAVNDGHWHHVAVTRSSGSGAMRLYVDGQLEAAGTSGTGRRNDPYYFAIGALANELYQYPNINLYPYNFFRGRLDEVRFFYRVRSGAEIAAAYKTIIPVPQPSPNSYNFIGYFAMEQGSGSTNNYAPTSTVASGDNTILQQIANTSGGYFGNGQYLNNFDLSSGNTTSNFVESYALVAPTATAATGVGTSGFTANWTASALGTVDSYVLDVATSATFAPATLVSGSPFTLSGSTTSQALTGLSTATTYYYRVRAEKAALSPQGQGAYSNLMMVSTPGPSPYVPPGNALVFDGSDDYVAVNALPAADNLGLGGFTLETWVYVASTGAVHSLIRKDGDYNLYLNSGGLLGCDVWPGGPGSSALTSTVATTALTANRWYHVAATRSGTTTQLYLNGVDVTGNSTPGTAAVTSPLQLGRSGFYNQPLTGRLDETRIYNAALTPAQVQADLSSTSAAVPASLLLYYNFDQGTAGGSNAAYSTLPNQSAAGANAGYGILTNFSLSSGNTTSNYVGSYALIAPRATATVNHSTDFTAMWTAPLLNGAAVPNLVDGYILEVSTSPTFASMVTGAPFTLSGYTTTSQLVTGLTSGTDYYYRVRATNASLGQSANSNVMATHTIGTEARLTSLLSSTGVLSPAFATGTTSYSLYVPAGTSTFTLTPTASNNYTAVVVNGTQVYAGGTSAALPVGTTATIELRSEDNQATATYTVQSVVAPTYFRSAATGPWGTAATWESSSNNLEWQPASIAPETQFGATVAVRNGHTVTVAAPLTLKTATIESGGVLNTLAGQTLTVPTGGTMTVNAGGVLSIGRLTGADAVTGTSLNLGTLSLNSNGRLTVNGTLVLNTGATTPVNQGITATTTTVGSGGRVVQYATTTPCTYPALSWGAGTTLELAGGVQNQFFAWTFNQTLQNLEVNLTGLPAGFATSPQPYLFTMANNAPVVGTLTVRSTGAGTLRLFNNGSSSGTLTLGSVDGSGNRSGGYVQLPGTNVIGSYGGSNTTSGTPINVLGSFQLNGNSTFAAAQASSTALATIRTTALTTAGDISVASGATFNMLSDYNPTFLFSGGAVVVNGNFSNAGTVSSGNTASNVPRLIFGKAGVQTFSGPGTVTGKVNVQVNAGSTLDLGSSSFAGTGNFTTVAGSTLRLGSPAGISASGTATGNVQTTGTRSFAAGTSFEFNGTTAQTTGTGFPTAALSAVSTLTFNNAAGVTLAQALAVPGTLRLQQGPVTTTSTTLLTLGTSSAAMGTLNATASNTGRVVGPFRRWVAASTGPRDFPVGTATVGRPATINFTTAPTAGGTLTAEFIAQPAGNQGLPLTENGVTINKAAASGYWRVAADGLTGGTYTPTFTLIGAVGVFDYTQLVLLKRADPSADWALVGAPVTTTGSNAAPVLSRTGVTGFSDFTAGGDLDVNPLPVELTSFVAERLGRGALLRWATASEKNSARFDIERSLDGKRFEKIGEERAQGSAARRTDYTFRDATTPPAPNTTYYRLRQVDLDGTASYSPVRVVQFGSTAAPAALALHAAPNPFRDQLTLTLDAPGALTGATLRLMDATGREWLHREVMAPAGASQLTLPGLAGLAPGLYVLHLAAPGQLVIRLKVVRE